MNTVSNSTNTKKKSIKKKGRRRKILRSFDYLIKEKIKKIDYRDINLLKRFINGQGGIVPRNYSKLLSLHHRRISLAIRRARQMALIPYEISLQKTTEHNISSEKT